MQMQMCSLVENKTITQIDTDGKIIMNILNIIGSLMVILLITLTVLVIYDITLRKSILKMSTNHQMDNKTTEMLKFDDDNVYFTSL